MMPPLPYLLAGIITLLVAAAACLVIAYLINKPDPGHHAIHVIPGYDAEPGDEWSPAAEWGDDTLGRMAAAYLAAPAETHGDTVRVGEPQTPGSNAQHEGRALGGLNNAHYVTGPVPLTPPAAIARTGPVTHYLHDPGPEGARDTGPSPRVVELHHQRQNPLTEHIAVAWHIAGENKRAGNWPMNPDLTESAWTRRSATQLLIDLAYNDTAAGFATINPQGIVDYAFSGSHARWAS